MKKHNRLISVLLCLVMILSCFSMAAAAEEDTVVVKYAIIGESVLHHTQILPKGSAIGSADYPSDPVREGKQFAGWFYNSMEGRVSVDTSFVPTNDITLLAKMEDVTCYYTVTYAVPGEGVYHRQTLAAGSSIASGDYPENPSSPAGCFECWYYNTVDGRVPVTSEFVPTGDITLLSQWKASHNWQEATCTEAKVCQDCGYIDGTAAGHTWKEADCTTPKTCEVCGATEGEALGHTWSADYVAANADADKHYHVCTVCNAKDAGAAHEWNAEAATEENDKHCEICGYVAEEQQGHVHAGTLVEAKEATCTETGNKAYYVCACGKWFEDASCTVEIADHDSVVIGTTEHTPAADDGDCTTAILCTVCGIEVVPGNAAHTGGTATCTEQAKCEVCGTAYGELAAHTWSADYVAANADADKHYHVCTVCNVKDAGAAHEWNAEAATEENDKHCEICGYVAQAQLEHVHVGTLVEAKEATCTETGNKAYYVCACGMWFEDASCTVEIADHDSVNVAALEHTPECKDAREATETEPGYTGDMVCSLCGEVLEKGKEIPATGKVTEPTKPATDPEPQKPADTTKPQPSDETKKPSNPKTGDSNFFLLMGMLLISGAGVVGTTAYGKKKKSK